MTILGGTLSHNQNKNQLERHGESAKSRKYMVNHHFHITFLLGERERERETV